MRHGRKILPDRISRRISSSRMACRDLFPPVGAGVSFRPDMGVGQAGPSGLAPPRPNMGRSTEGVPQSTSISPRTQASRSGASSTNPQVQPLDLHGDIDDMMVQDERGEATTTRATEQAGFARFLPDFFFTREQHDIALDRFLRYFGCWAQRVTPHLFYRDMEIAQWTEVSELPVMAPNYSPLLHNYALAVGLAFSDEEHLRAQSTRRLFAKEGDSTLERECSTPCVGTVQGLAVRASWASTMGDYSLGWVHQGLATRVCYALGLNVDTSSLVAKGKLDHESAVQRNVTFWTCYCQETLWSQYIGRKPVLMEYSVPLPTADPATDATLWMWPLGAHQALAPQKSYLSTAFIHTVILIQACTEITRTMYAGRADKSALVENGTVERFSDTLDRILEDLPSELSVDPTKPDPVLPHILMVHLTFSWTVVLLYQPFSQVTRAVPDGDFERIGLIAMTRCHQAALRIVQLAAVWDEQHSLRFTPPTLSAIIYSAGTSFLLAAAQAGLPSQTAAAMQKVHDCLGFLEEIGRTWKAGRQQAAVLRGLLNECAQATRQVPALLGIERGWDGPQTEQPSYHEPEPGWTAGGDDSFDDFVRSLLDQQTFPLAGYDSMPMNGFLN
ncbi:hypothetical protein CcaverHIS002_0410670 [Cutaneotrichosporon cavernicola]|nr:hypothetical protein CcaverHIS002_0410670 [Cutaneotrichosporon cavernicola]